MCINHFLGRIFLSVLLLICWVSATANEKVQKPKPLHLHWEIAIPDGRDPVTQELRPTQRLPEFILRTGSDEFIAIRNEIVPFSRHHIGEGISLDTEAQILDAALDAKGDIWAVGRVNQRGYAASAYLGKFSRNGHKLAEFAFGGELVAPKYWWQKLSPYGPFRQLVALYPRRDGNILVAGPKGLSPNEGNGTWLANISDQGKILWEKTIGLPADAAIVEGQDGNVAFAGLRKANSTDRPYEEEVVFWLFDSKGSALAEQVIRPNINEHPGSQFMRVDIEATKDSYFALVRGGNPSDDKPLSVVKISRDGVVQWSVVLKHTATLWEGRSSPRWNKCDQKQVVLGNGDLLVTCSVEGQIVLSRLDGTTGAEKIQKAILPSCHEKRPTIVMPILVAKNSVLLLGSRPSGNVGASCSWLADWTLEP